MFLHFIWSSRVGQCVDIPLVGLCSYDCLISRAVYRILWRENIERCTHANTSPLHLRHLSTSYFKMNLLLFSATSVTCCVCQSILAFYSSILALYATRVALNKYMWLVTSAAWAENVQNNVFLHVMILQPFRETVFIEMLKETRETEDAYVIFMHLLNTLC